MKFIYSTLFILFVGFSLHAKNAPKNSPILEGHVYETVDGHSQPIPFANVMCKGTTVGTFAGTEGNFKLNLEAGKHTIIISCYGYEPITKTVKVKKNSDLHLFNIKLNPLQNKIAQN